MKNLGIQYGPQNADFVGIFLEILNDVSVRGTDQTLDVSTRRGATSHSGYVSFGIVPGTDDDPEPTTLFLKQSLNFALISQQLLSYQPEKATDGRRAFRKLLRFNFRYAKVREAGTLVQGRHRPACYIQVLRLWWTAKTVRLVFCTKESVRTHTAGNVYQCLFQIVGIYGPYHDCALTPP